MFDGVIAFCFGIVILIFLGIAIRGVRLLYEYERGVVSHWVSIPACEDRA